MALSSKDFDAVANQMRVIEAHTGVSLDKITALDITVRCPRAIGQPTITVQIPSTDPNFATLMDVVATYMNQGLVAAQSVVSNLGLASLAGVTVETVSPEPIISGPPTHTPIL